MGEVIFFPIALFFQKKKKTKTFCHYLEDIHATLSASFPQDPHPEPSNFCFTNHPGENETHGLEAKLKLVHIK